MLAALALSAHALPTGGSVSAGSGSIAASGGAMTVTQSSPNLSLNWQSFSIAPSESVRFAQPGSSSVALNRVLGSDASQIFGSLQANGQVFLVNPNGILFGRTAQVNVGGLVASTLNITDADFLAGKRTFSGSGGSVVNQGTLTGGYIALLGGQVSNQGTITAQLGTAALAAGNQVTLDFAGDKLITVSVDQSALEAAVQNSGSIEADGGTVILTAAATDGLLGTVINNSGVIRAQTLEAKNGSIYLLGGEEGAVQVAGTLDASAPNGGNGGFIETSGAKVDIADSAIITAAAPYGTPGTWLIDPKDFTIAASKGDITGSKLSDELASGNVTIQSSDGKKSGSGDIFVNDGVAWSANTALTLSAERNIEINALIAASGNAAGLTLTPGTGGSGTYLFGNDGRVDLTGSHPSLTIAGDVYTVINDLNALQNMSANLAGHYALGSNIDASATRTWNAGAGFKPIGDYRDVHPDDPPDLNHQLSFKGSFEGLNHSITGLTINRPITDAVGLFGNSSGSVAHVAVIDASIVPGWSAGAVVGLNLGGTVSGSSSSGTISNPNSWYVGGLVGSNQGTVKDSHSAATVNGRYEVGGLVGANHGPLTGSYSTGDVHGYRSVGGLVGFNAGSVANDYSTGSVTGTSYVGGLVGWNYHVVTRSYSTGAVSGFDEVGGLVGLNGYDVAPQYYPTATIETSYSTGPVTGTLRVGGLVGSNSSGAVLDSFSESGVTAGNTSGEIGGLIGNNKGSVTRSHSSGSVVGRGDVGGLVGRNTGSVSRSYSSSAVTGNNDIGGLVGYNFGPITESYSTGAVKGSFYVGGLAGTNNDSPISDSYSTGNVSGDTDVGGLVGNNYGGTIVDSYSAGAVSGSHFVGGLAGFNSGAVTNSFWDIQISGTTTSAGGTGLTTKEMQRRKTFTQAGWDFKDVWTLKGRSYPLLRAFLQ